MGDISLYAINVCFQFIDDVYANVVLITLVSWHAVIGLFLAVYSGDQGLIW
jgi:hypothetical protein